MPKPTAAWGLDIGQCALKALRLELVDGKPTATAFDYIEHPKILSQPDADPDSLTREALEKFLSRNQIKNDIVGLSVAGQSGLARFVKLPPVEVSKIAEIVKFEAKQQIPFPLEEVVWDYQKVAGGELINNFAMETEIGLFAMKREMIAKHMSQLNAVNIECHVVQMAPLALCNYGTYEVLGQGGPDAVDPAAAEASDDTPRGKKRCSVLLDVGTDGSNLLITDGGKIIWQRPLPLGGNHFTRALTKEMKLTFAKAEHLKRNAAKSPDLGAILKALRPVLTDFVGEVQRSLGYFTNTHRDAHVAYMIGLGSAFRLPGLQKYMAEKLSLDVRKPAKFTRLQGDVVLNDPVFSENLLSFPIAYGLALQGLNQLGDRTDYGRLNTNLLPQEIKMDRMIRAKKPYAAAAAAAILLGTGTLAFGFGMQYSAVTDAGIKAAITTSKTAVTSADSQNSAKSSGESAIQALQTDVKSVIAGNDDRATLARLNEVIMAALPRAGQGGNLDDDGRRYLWATDRGPEAIKLATSRVRNGVPLDKAFEDDLTEYLAQVNIEVIYPRYSDDLKSVMERIDTMTWRDFNRPIAVYMKDDEREKEETITAKQFKPKGPDGAGWMVQVSGYTYHRQGIDFLVKGLVRNLQNVDAVATDTGMVRDKEGKEIPKISKYLIGAPDPIKGRISHVALVYYKAYDNPVPKQYDVCDKFYLDRFMSAGAGGGVPGMDGGGGPGMPGGMMGSPGGSPGGGPEGMMGPGGGAAAGPSWRPLGGGGGGATGGMFGGGSPGLPGMEGGPGMMGMGGGPGAGPGGFGGSEGGGKLGGGGAMLPGAPGAMGGSPGMPGMTGGPGGGPGMGGAPGAVVPSATKSAPPKQRHEFVIVFAWKDAGGAAGATPAPDAPAAPPAGK